VASQNLQHLRYCRRSAYRGLSSLAWSLQPKSRQTAYESSSRLRSRCRFGGKVGMSSAYLAYVARCKARDRVAVTPEHFFEATDQVCRQNSVPIELIDGKPHLWVTSSEVAARPLWSGSGSGLVARC